MIFRSVLSLWSIQVSRTTDTNIINYWFFIQQERFDIYNVSNEVESGTQNPPIFIS